MVYDTCIQSFYIYILSLYVTAKLEFVLVKVISTATHLLECVTCPPVVALDLGVC